MRWIRLPAILLLLVGGCTAAGDDDRRPAGTAASRSPTAAASQSPSADAVPDAFAAAGIRATRVVPELGPEPGSSLELVDPVEDLLAAGDRLIARRSQPLSGRRVASSADLGRTWQAVDLPGVTEADGVPLLNQVGPVVVVTAHEKAWVTADGVTWRGGPVPVTPAGFLLNRPAQHVGGALVVGVTGKNGEGLALTTDGGATWRAVDCPTVSRPTGSRDRCEAVTPAGGALWVRWYEVSVDSGRTWRKTSIVPDPGSSISPMLQDLVTLPGGGWLGPVITALSPSLWSYLLVRSRDGLTWEPVIPYPCERSGDRKSTVSRPQALGGRWLVAYTCTDRADDAVRSFLYLIDRDGTNPRVLTTIDEPGHWYGAPVTIGDTVVVPEVRSDGRGLDANVTFLHLQA